MSEKVFIVIHSFDGQTSARAFRGFAAAEQHAYDLVQEYIEEALETVPEDCTSFDSLFEYAIDEGIMGNSNITIEESTLT